MPQSWAHLSDRLSNRLQVLTRPLLLMEWKLRLEKWNSCEEGVAQFCDTFHRPVIVDHPIVIPHSETKGALF